MNGVINHLIFVSPKRGLLFVTDVRGTLPTGKQEHLSCFLPGLLAMGANVLTREELPDRDRTLHQWAAEGLAYTCYLLYSENPSGLAPEEVTFYLIGADGKHVFWDDMKWVNHIQKWVDEGGVGKPPGVGNLAKPMKLTGMVDMTAADYLDYNSNYYLRPETIESVYYMWLTTGDPIWRSRGWEMFQAVETQTRTEHGYSSVKNIRGPLSQSDSMPSYFLAETLKYFYLLFLDTNPWPLDKYVYNTEAHPFPVFEWRSWEKESLGIH